MKYIRRYCHRKEMLKWKRYIKHEKLLKQKLGYRKLKAEWTFPENPTEEQMVNNFCQIILALNKKRNKILTTPIIDKNGGNQ